MPGQDFEPTNIKPGWANVLRARLDNNPRDLDAKEQLIAAGLEFTTKERNVEGLEGLKFRKSSYSTQDNCVEVGVLDGTVYLRDTKNRDAEPQKYSGPEWQAFLDGARAGEFDLA